MKKAYSLLELTIVILIVSILVSGGLSVPIRNAYNKNIETTNIRLDKIDKALKRFLIQNKRLPCPAAIINSKLTSANYGNEGQAVGSCVTDGGYISSGFSNLIYGMVPVRALGLTNEMAEDGFGNKFGYMIDKNFSDSATFGSAIAIDNIVIQNRAGGNLQVITNDAIFAVISYGANGSGAFSAKSFNLNMQNQRSSDSDELQNDIDASNSDDFDNILIAKSMDSDIFDDVILFKTRDQLVSESKMLSLIKCPEILDIASDISYGLVSIGWPQGNYDEIVPANTICPEGYRATVSYATRRCGAFGIWDNPIHQCILEEI